MRRRKVPEMSMMDILAWQQWTAPEWAPFKVAWVERGFASPPSAAQQEMLWEIARMRPQDLAEWIREAPGRRATRREVITHVLDHWHGIQDDIKRRELDARADKAADEEAARRAWEGLTRALGSGGDQGRGEAGLVQERGSDPSRDVIRALVGQEEADLLHRRNARPSRVGEVLQRAAGRSRLAGPAGGEGEASPERPGSSGSHVLVP